MVPPFLRPKLTPVWPPRLLLNLSSAYVSGGKLKPLKQAKKEKQQEDEVIGLIK
jgi:Translation machinery associated TMA7